MAQASCPHFEQLSYHSRQSSEKDHHSSSSPLERLKRALDGDRACQVCGKVAKSNYICLNPQCLLIGCGREDKRHALEHFRQHHRSEEGKCHSVAMSVGTFQCWCYECDDMIAPPVLVALESRLSASNAPSINNISSSKRQVTRTFLAAPPLGVVGLYNLGNSCYMNAALQALLNCPSISGFLRNCTAFIHRQSNRKISESFHRLMETIMTAKLTAISPSQLVREVKLINPMFHGYTQQDTMDFVRCMFERLHEELKYSIDQDYENHSSSSPSSTSALSSSSSPSLLSSLSSSSATTSSSSASSLPASHSAPSKSQENVDHAASKGKTRNHHNSNYTSIISETFGGVLRSEIDCQRCRNVSVKEDPFLDLSVQICSNPDGSKPSRTSLGYLGTLLGSLGESIGLNGRPVRLETCLSAFCAPENLEGKDRYRCDHCKDLVASKKSLKIKTLPQVLCIQLKRFRHESYFSSKISTHVIFPLDNLDMRPYLHETALGHRKQETRYYLSAVISHRGTFSGGHYIAYCRHHSSGQWLEFDDADVTVVSEEEVGKVQAYALFYSLVDWGIRREREEWLGPILATAENSTTGSSDASPFYVSRQWFNRWRTMAYPGPLDNRELSCIHGGALAPEKGVDVHQLVQPLPRIAYEYFVRVYGERSKGPPLRQATVCETCQEEAKRLDERRRREERGIQALDTSSIREGECWYLISAEWLILWGQFKSGLGSPPGPISNHLLVMADGTPRSNLVRGTHYRGVNRHVWAYFVQIYGGGPEIVRKSINIYAPPPTLPTEASTHEEPTAEGDVFVDVESQ